MGSHIMDKKHFITVLSTQLVLLKELLTLLEQETIELTSINITSMETLNQRKAETTVNIEAQSAVLRQSLAEYAAAHGLSPEITLGTVITMLAGKDILQLHTELKSVAQRVQDVAALNLEIAERFAETASTSLNLLTRLINQSSLYGTSGGYQTRPTGSIMINREA